MADPSTPDPPTPDPPTPDKQQVFRLLSGRYGTTVRYVRPLGAGRWSRAFAFDTDTAPLVVRFGDHDEDFEKDRIAAAWQQPGLPVPKFLEMGEAFGTFFAVTERAEGEFLDSLTRRDVSETFPALLHVLDALRRIPVDPAAGFGGWNRDCVAEHRSWKDALLAVATERPRTGSWRRRLAEWPECEQAFHRAFERLTVLADDVPSRHDLIHSDWVNRNVLVAEGNITAVFDWGSSMYGDHLYDVAWLVFCTPYTSGFDRLETRRLLREHYVSQGLDPDDFDRRIECYELHIGLGALTYQVVLGDRDTARWVASRFLEISSPKDTTG
jgi:hygromycin-B 4-O-kinase